MPKLRPDPKVKHRETRRLLALAERGQANAQDILGAQLAQGYFIKQDERGALYWYVQAIKQGYTHSKWNAGTMLIKGEGVDAPAVDLGLMLIEQAANSGQPSAVRFMHNRYATGGGGKPADENAARYWLECTSGIHPTDEYGDALDLEALGIRVSKPKIEFQ